MKTKTTVLKKIIVGLLLTFISSSPYSYAMKRKGDEVSKQRPSKRPCLPAPQASSSSQRSYSYICVEDTPAYRTVIKYLFPHTQVKDKVTDGKSFFEMKNSEGSPYIALFSIELVKKINGDRCSNEEIIRVFTIIHSGFSRLIEQLKNLVGVCEQTAIDQMIIDFIQTWLKGEDTRVRLTLINIVCNFNTLSSTPTLLVRTVWNAFTEEEKSRYCAAIEKLQEQRGARLLATVKERPLSQDTSSSMRPASAHSAYTGATTPTVSAPVVTRSSAHITGDKVKVSSHLSHCSVGSIELVSVNLKKVKEFLAEINGCTQVDLYRRNTLVLRNVPLKDPFFLRTLFAFISRLSTVTTLKFEGAFLGNLNQKALATLFAEMSLLHNIRIIDLSSNDLGNLDEDQLTAMLSNFAAMPNLEKLIFDLNSLHNLSPVGWQTIFTELAVCPMLSEISFKCNFLGSLDQRCCEIFMQGLVSLDKLKVLELGGNGFGWAHQDSWAAFVGGLARFTRLERINLSNNFFGGVISERQEKLSSLFDSISQMRSLCSLGLNDNELCSVGKKEWLLVENTISYLSSLNLVELSLNDYMFSEEGVRRVYALQQQFPRLGVVSKPLEMKDDLRIQKVLAGAEEEEEETDKE